MEMISAISEFFASPAGITLYVTFKVLFILISAGLLVGILAVIWKLRLLNKAIVEAEQFLITPPPAAIPKFSEKWEAIRAKAQSDNPDEYKIAVIEADKMLDDVLERAGFIGDSLADKLNSAEKGQIANIDALKAAHRLRNAIAHDVNARISPSEARQAIGIYERALEDLEAI